MMANGTALATQSDISLDELQRTAKMLVASGYFDAKGAPEVQIAQIATKIMAGRELGYGPFASVQGIHIIQGRPQISANLMAAAVKSHPRYGYKVVKMDPDAVAIEFFENGEHIGTSTFTLEDAKRAGTQNLQKFPRNMLFARALSNGVRWFCPDVFHGQAVYVEGEIEESDHEQPAYIVVDRSTGEVIEGEVVTPVTPTNGTSTANGNGHKPELPFDDSKNMHENAIDWAMGQGVFSHLNHAQNSYKKHCADVGWKPKSGKANDDAMLWGWVRKVEGKKAEAPQAEQDLGTVTEDDVWEGAGPHDTEPEAVPA
jgi:hypothetical protein